MALTAALMLTHWLPATAVVVAWVVLMAASGCYRVPGPSSVFLTMGRAALVLLAGAEAIGWSRPLLRDRLLATIATVFVVSVSVRAVARMPFFPQPVRRLLLAGDPQAVQRLITELPQGHSCWQVVCVGVPGSGDSGVFGVPQAGLHELPQAVRQHGVDAVVMLPGPELPADALRQLAWRLEGTRTQVFLSTAMVGLAVSRPAVLSPFTSALRLAGAAPNRGAQLLKSVSERAVALLALVVVAPLLAVCMLLIRLDSPGGAIFRQERVGRHGRRFVMLKLRTMATDAEARLGQLRELNESEGGVLFKIQADPRVTRVGRFLRRYSLDEVPQLWNVVRGDMALVGPRPALPEEVEQYDELARRRLAVRPGLTGLWQVCGRSNLPWDAGLRLDVHYVDHWSLGLDLTIVLQTARAVLRHTGAY